jgi:hypothetical protein
LTFQLGGASCVEISLWTQKLLPILKQHVKAVVPVREDTHRGVDDIGPSINAQHRTNNGKDELSFLIDVTLSLANGDQ